MAKKKVAMSDNDVIIEGEPVTLPTMPLAGINALDASEEMSALSEMYPELFPVVKKKHKRSIRVKLITILIVFLAVDGFLVYHFNKYVGLLSVVDSQVAQIDSELQRRANLVPNLVKAMETYTAYENRLVSHLAEMRSTLVPPKSVANKGKVSSSKPIGGLEKVEAKPSLSDPISRLLAIAENYPDLKASATFQTLMTQLAETENRIAEQRTAYNSAAMAYNNQLKSIPGVLLRHPFRLKPVEYFEADSTVKKLPIVEFDLTQQSGG